MTLAPYRLGTDRSTESPYRLPRTDPSYRLLRTRRTDGEELQGRGNLSVRTARVARPLLDPAHVLLVVGLVLHAATNRPPKPPAYEGRHRTPPTPERGGNGISWWIWTAVATGYAWLTWRMAVIDLPLLVAAGVAMTFVLAYTAGRNSR